MDDMELDLSICAQNHVIHERELISINDEIWGWGVESTLNYNFSPNRAEKLQIIEGLIAGIEDEDFDNNETSDASSEKIKSDSGIASMDTLNWEAPKIETGLTYFVPNKRGKWRKAKLVEIKNTQLDLVDLQTQERIVSDFLSLAHAEPVLRLVPVGSRVVAHHCRIPTTGEVKRRGRLNYQLGVVAELPTKFNRERYLVFFDNGSWNYVKPELVRPGYYVSDRIWEVVPIQNRKMVQEFLNRVSEMIIDWKVGDHIWVKKNCEEVSCFRVYRVFSASRRREFVTALVPIGR
ncbi:histone-lysine N-methyltransferase eggless-like isoform X2 [Tribolium madens]|uniref:histone-lysine N-methyltransferase eggless-like isoform X2 n=1 Tax=Tribolium madens TaxID=41895 RepID=UPI001CF75C45|nr:histone-lysine N-methyltransferase eggless-like isoform X2 [Tribolium madens]